MNEFDWLGSINTKDGKNDIIRSWLKLKDFYKN